MHCMEELTSRVFVAPRYRDAGRRPAARPFVQDAQSAMPQPASRSRLRLEDSTDLQAVAWHFGRLERMA